MADSDEPLEIRPSNCVCTFFLGVKNVDLFALCRKITGFTFKHVHSFHFIPSK